MKELLAECFVDGKSSGFKISSTKRLCHLLTDREIFNIILSIKDEEFAKARSN